MPQARSTDQWVDQLAATLPQGPFWERFREEDTDERGLLIGIAAVLSRFQQDADRLIGEQNPLYMTELLIAREVEAGLPDACTDPAETAYERRERVVQKWAATGGGRPTDLIAIARAAGFAVCVMEPRAFRCGQSVCGHALTNDGWRHWFRIGAPSDTIKATFRAGIGSCGEPLRRWNNDTLECVIDQAKPAHTAVQFAYGPDVCGGLAGSVVTSGD